MSDMDREGPDSHVRVISRPSSGTPRNTRSCWPLRSGSGNGISIPSALTSERLSDLAILSWISWDSIVGRRRIRAL